MSDYTLDTIPTAKLVVRAERQNMLQTRLADSAPEDTSFDGMPSLFRSSAMRSFHLESRAFWWSGFLQPVKTK